MTVDVDMTNNRVPYGLLPGEEGEMKKLVYTGATDEQVRWGGNSDPRGVLIEGHTYTLERTDVRSWHTKIKLVGIDGWFNSVCFDDVKEPTK